MFCSVQFDELQLVTSQILREYFMCFGSLHITPMEHNNRIAEPTPPQCHIRHGSTYSLWPYILNFKNSASAFCRVPHINHPLLLQIYVFQQSSRRPKTKANYTIVWVISRFLLPIVKVEEQWLQWAAQFVKAATACQVCDYPVREDPLRSEDFRVLRYSNYRIFSFNKFIRWWTCVAKWKSVNWT